MPLWCDYTTFKNEQASFAADFSMEMPCEAGRSTYPPSFPLQNEPTELVRANCTSLCVHLCGKGFYSRTSMDWSFATPTVKERALDLLLCWRGKPGQLEHERLAGVPRGSPQPVLSCSPACPPCPSLPTAALPACPAALGCLPSPPPQPQPLLQGSHRTVPNVIWTLLRPFWGFLSCLDELSHIVFFP